MNTNNLLNNITAQFTTIRESVEQLEEPYTNRKVLSALSEIGLKVSELGKILSLDSEIIEYTTLVDSMDSLKKRIIEQNHCRNAQRAEHEEPPYIIALEIFDVLRLNQVITIGEETFIEYYRNSQSVVQCRLHAFSNSNSQARTSAPQSQENISSQEARHQVREIFESCDSLFLPYISEQTKNSIRVKISKFSTSVNARAAKIEENKRSRALHTLVAAASFIPANPNELVTTKQIWAYCLARYISSRVEYLHEFLAINPNPPFYESIHLLGIIDCLLEIPLLGDDRLTSKHKALIEFKKRLEDGVQFREKLGREQSQEGSKKRKRDEFEGTSNANSDFSSKKQKPNNYQPNNSNVQRADNDAVLESLRKEWDPILEEAKKSDAEIFKAYLDMKAAMQEHARGNSKLLETYGKNKRLLVTIHPDKGDRDNEKTKFLRQELLKIYMLIRNKALNQEEGANEMYDTLNSTLKRYMLMDQRKS